MRVECSDLFLYILKKIKHILCIILNITFHNGIRGTQGLLIMVFKIWLNIIFLRSGCHLTAANQREKPYSKVKPVMKIFEGTDILIDVYDTRTQRYTCPPKHDISNACVAVCGSTLWILSALFSLLSSLI